MAQFFENLSASWKIFYSNTNARFGALFNWLLVILIVALLGAALVRCVSAGMKADHNRKALKGREPDAARTAHAAESLAEAIKCQTVAGASDELKRLTEYLKSRYGTTLSAIHWAKMPDGSLLLRWPGSDHDLDPVLFSGHLDVAPVQGEWVHEPFGGQQEDGVIYGRGTVSGKSSVIAMLEAAEELTAAGFTPRRDVYFAFGGDETMGGKTGAGEMAELLQQRGLRFAAVLEEGGYIAEDHMNQPEHAAALIALGEKQSCDFKLVANVKGGDSSVPGRHTALGVLSEAICRIDSAQPHHHLSNLTREYLKRSMYALTFGKRFIISNLPLSEMLLVRTFRRDRATLSVLRSTVAATQISGSEAPNMLAARADALLSARLLPGETPENMLRYLRELVGDLPVTVELTESTQAVAVTSSEHEMYKLLCSAIREEFSLLPCLATLLPGKTDSRYYAPMTDCILRFAPLIQDVRQSRGAYRAEEHLTVRSLGLAVEVYAGFLRKL